MQRVSGLGGGSFAGPTLSMRRSASPVQPETTRPSWPAAERSTGWLSPSPTGIYLTRAYAAFNGDTQLSAYDESEWQLLSQEDLPADDGSAFDPSYLVLKRRIGLADDRSRPRP